MKPLVISLGHRFRQDDGAGPLALDALKSTLAQQSDFIENTGDAAALIDDWKDREYVILIDACQDDTSKAGKIYRLNGLNDPLPSANPVASSHALNLANAIELGRVLNSLPRTLIIYSIVGKAFSYGEIINARILASIDDVVTEITQELHTINPSSSGAPSCMSSH